MEMVAREIIPPLRDDAMLHREADGEDDDGDESDNGDDDEYDDIVGPELVDELLRDPMVVLERQNDLIPPAQHEASALEPIALSFLTNHYSR